MTSSSAGDAPLGLLPTEVQPRNESAVDSDLTRELFGQANVSLDALSAAYQILHGQTVQVAIGNSGEDQRINDVGLDVEKQQLRHKEGIAEIQSIINNILDEQAFAQLRNQIEKEISLQIDDIVQAQVAACLQTHIPKELQDEVEDNKQELERARIALHNSESRRMNGKLRTDNPDGKFDTLLMPTGLVSQYFPKEIRSLLNLDAESCKGFATDYQFPQISDNRETNLNKIMQFIGLRYQLVNNQNGSVDEKAH